MTTFKPEDFIQIPRKLDAVEMTADPDLYLIGINLEILVNGEPQRGVTAYNLDEGWVAKYLTIYGKTAIDFPSGQPIIHRTYSDNIEVKWKQNK